MYNAKIALYKGKKMCCAATFSAQDRACLSIILDLVHNYKPARVDQFFSMKKNDDKTEDHPIRLHQKEFIQQ